MTPSPEDLLSDAEAESMDRAMAGPHAWANYDAGVCPLGVRADDRAEWYASRLAAIRRAWAARPSTARDGVRYLRADPELLALIEAAKAWSETKPGDDVLASQIRLHEAASEYARSMPNARNTKSEEG